MKAVVLRERCRVVHRSWHDLQLSEYIAARMTSCCFTESALNTVRANRLMNGDWPRRSCKASLLGRPLPTVNFRVDYLRPAIDTALVVTATVRRSGRLVGVVDIDVANEAGQLLAIGRATYAAAP